jgi:Domain of unknown function (DUF4386)
MDNAKRGRNWAAVTGIGFVIITGLGVAVAGEPPKTADAAADIARYFTDKRSEVLASSSLWFIAAILLLWFLGVLHSHLRTADAGKRLSATALGGGIFGAVFLTASICGTNAAALEIASAGAEPLAVKGFYDLAGACFAMSGIGFAVFYWATASAGLRDRSLPRWLCWFAVAAGTVQLLYAYSLTATQGPLAYGGSIGVLEPLFSMLWFLAASLVLLRSPVGPSVKDSRTQSAS